MKKVRSWSHVLWVTNDKIYAKKLLPARPKSATRREKRKKTARLFALEEEKEKNTDNCKAFLYYTKMLKEEEEERGNCKDFCVTCKRIMKAPQSSVNSSCYRD